MSRMFGTYWTKKFSDIFGSTAVFKENYDALGLGGITDNAMLNKLYYLLYAQYGNSHIANFDGMQFKIKVFTLIYQYGATWEKRIVYQEKIRALTDEELIQGAKNIYNHSYNPSTDPSTGTLEELTTVDDQNTTNFKKSKLEAYFQATQYLEDNFTKEFIDKFKSLFLKIVEPQEPLLYESDDEVMLYEE